MGKIKKTGKRADFRGPDERRQIGSDAKQNKEERYAWPAFCLGGASPPILELRRFLYLYLLLTSDPLGSPQNPARVTSMKKYNQFYTHLQSHSRGEITLEELQNEANKLFLSGK